MASCGVGESRSRNSAEAGAAAARAAIESLDGPPTAVLVFATTGHDQQALIDAVRSETGDATLSGCSAAGVITRSGSDEGSHCVAVLAFRCERATARAAIAEGAGDDPRAAARELLSQIGDDQFRLLVVMPDGLTTNVSSLLDELGRGLPPGTPIFGGSAGEMMEFTHTYQYCDGRVVSGGVAALAIGGEVEPVFRVSHGCHPIGIEHEVTRSDGGLVHELDGRPAWDVMREYIDEPTEDLNAEHMPYFCLGQRLPEEAAHEYGEYIIRVPLQLQKETGTLFFPGELPEGERLAMARREVDDLIARAVESVESLAEEREQEPLFVIQADCAGRGRVLFGESVTERLIEPIHRAYGRPTPWIGFHSYGEIAPIAGKAYFHNYTMALCALYERRT